MAERPMFKSQLPPYRLDDPGDSLILSDLGFDKNM